VQIYINESFPKRSDMEDFSTMQNAARLLEKGYGFKTASKTMLQEAGLKSIPSFLWRSPIFDSVELVSGADKLHQDWLGPAKKLQRFLCGLVSGSTAKTEPLNLWMTRLRDNGVAGLISDQKLMTMAQMQVCPSIYI
jgi:hypothetical protein